MQRPTYDHMSSQKPAQKTSLPAANPTDLYWFVQVVQAGSFSAAAQYTGMAKSNLSRRIIHLEKRLDVQLLIRKPRGLRLTPVGSRIYYHALEMLSATEAIEALARQATGVPRGKLQLAAPGILGQWLYDCLRTFRDTYPDVELHVLEADGQTDLASEHLDISFSLYDVASNSTDIVSMALAQLEMVIVGAPHIVERLGKPERLEDVTDLNLLTTKSPSGIRPWLLMDGDRSLHVAALCAPDYQAVLNGARAGLGLACIPLHGCIADLGTRKLLNACQGERPKPLMLYALLNPHRSITPAARALVEHLRSKLKANKAPGILEAGNTSLAP